MKKSVFIRRNLTPGEKSELRLFCDSLSEGFAATDDVQLARELSVISWQGKLRQTYARTNVTDFQEVADGESNIS